MKASTGKASLPGPKQVFREWRDGRMAGDTIALAGEALAGEPLLQPVMRAGERLDPPPALEAIRERAAAQREALPPGVRRLDTVREDAYPVRISELLGRERERVATQAGAAPTSSS